MASINNNETVHVSLGNTANHITSHLLNLQGLAATSTSENASSSGGGEDYAASASLCDPSVTHEISPLDSDCYSAPYYRGGGGVNPSPSRYMYVPRTLIVDGRDSFGSSWGGVSCDNTARRQQQQQQQQQQHPPTSPTSSSFSPNILALNDPNDSVAASTWGGTVEKFDSAILLGDRANDCDAREPPRHRRQPNGGDEDERLRPVDKFRDAASAIGLSPIHSRFNAAPPPATYSSYSAGSGNNSGRHVQWDEEGGEEEEEEDWDYGDDRDIERRQEEKRRRMERMEYQQSEARRNWNSCMEDAFEDAFYGDNGDSNGSQQQHDSTASGYVGDKATSFNSNNEADSDTKDTANERANDATATTNATQNFATERKIQWYDYWMPPKPSPTKYQVPLPFDTSLSSNDASKNSTAWSTSFNMGYHPASGGGGGSALNGLGGNDSAGGITRSWREHVLSESLRKVLEGCDVVKGFNVYVDGGDHSCAGFAGNKNNNAGTDKHAKELSGLIAGGGFHAGLATSLLEELSDECRSAGRWVVMVDPPLPNAGDAEGGSEVNQVHCFRQCLNAGLALHGLSTNADAFLPVSIDGAYCALRGDTTGSASGSSGGNVLRNRMLFEGSAAISLALETSTLFYRLRCCQPSSGPSNSSGGARRSRIGIQSGFYQGYSGNTGYDDSNNEPYATAPSLTYHEFLACARPSSDRRRSILELDALLRPISYSSAATGGGGLGGLASGGVDVASLLTGNAGGVSSSVLDSLRSAGLIAGGNNTLGELQKRMERGTSIGRMRMEQQRQQYRPRGRRSSPRQNELGGWLEDISTNSLGGGGLVSSLSGNSTPFGRRADHHHFALSTSLRPAASDVQASFSVPNPGGNGASSAFLRPMMEGMGVKYRPEVSLGAVVKDTVVDLTGIGSYWRSIFTNRTSPPVIPPASSPSDISRHQQEKRKPSPKEVASHSPILSVLGNSTRSYPRLSAISRGFVDAVHSHRNMGYFSRDVMAGIIPEKDDCEDALEYCQEVMDVYEPPMGSGLVLGEGENNDLNAYFDD